MWESGRGRKPKFAARAVADIDQNARKRTPRMSATGRAANHTCAAGGVIWKAEHDRIANYSKVGESMVVAGAGRVIQIDKPDAVVSAVREVVETVRRYR